MTAKKLSIIIPAYNESATLPLVLEKIAKAGVQRDIAKEIIIVDEVGISYYGRTYEEGKKRDTRTVSGPSTAY